MKNLTALPEGGVWSVFLSFVLALSIINMILTMVRYEKIHFERKDTKSLSHKENF